MTDFVRVDEAVVGRKKMDNQWGQSEKKNIIAIFFVEKIKKP